MFSKIVLVLMLSSSLIFAMSASVVQTIAKEELACIKGLGLKRVNLIVSYRTKHKINTLEELLSIKGIGKAIVENIRNDKEKKVCTNMHPMVKKKTQGKKKNIKAE